VKNWGGKHTLRFRQVQVAKRSNILPPNGRTSAKSVALTYSTGRWLVVGGASGDGSVPGRL